MTASATGTEPPAHAPRTVFIAVPVEPPAAEQARRLLAALGTAVPGVRWARPESLHVTVAFLGLMPRSRDAAVAAVAAPALAGIEPFDVVLRSLGVFPERGDPRVLWLGVAAGADGLGGAATALRTALGRAGLPAESRELRPHCTLGRPRRAWTAAARRAWAEASATPPRLPRFRATRAVLYESQPGPGGSRYLAVAELPFAGGRASARRAR